MVMAFSQNCCAGSVLVAMYPNPRYVKKEDADLTTYPCNHHGPMMAIDNAKAEQ